MAPALAHRVALLVALSLLAWTFAPICGSAADVDPAGCCERHGCKDEGAAPDRSHDSDGCCSRGEHSYPAANLRAAPALAAAAACAIVHALPATIAGLHDDAVGHAERPLKVPLPLPALSFTPLRI